MPSKSAKPGDRINSKRTVDYYDDSGKKIETKVGGTRPWRNNNPGNLQYFGPNCYAMRHGAIGHDEYPNEGKFAVFPDWETGMQAKRDLWKTQDYQNLSIKDALPKYAPPTENNIPAYMKYIKDKTGLSEDKVVSSLSDQEYNNLMDAIKEFESGHGSPKDIGTIIDHTKESAPDQSKPDKRSDALDRPVEAWSEADARQVMESPAYQRPSHPQHADAQEKVTEWHRMNYGDDAAEQDATGRTIPLDQIADSRGDNGNGSGGSVHVSSYTRSVKGHSVSVSDYWRRSARG